MRMHHCLIPCAGWTFGQSKLIGLYYAPLKVLNSSFYTSLDDRIVATRCKAEARDRADGSIEVVISGKGTAVLLG